MRRPLSQGRGQAIRQLGSRSYRAGLIRAARRTFPLWQRLGLHVVYNGYDDPIPDTRELRDTGFYARDSRLAGIDLRSAAQLKLVGDLGEGWGPELAHLPLHPTDDPHEFYLDNAGFNGVDARVLYALLRRFRPRRFYEVGSGFSTLLAAEALEQNRAEDGAAAELIAVEPYPKPFLRSLPALSQLIVEKVQNVPLSLFAQLEAGDVLFIDSTHILKSGSDVQYLYLEVLPSLKPGVFVHAHDIFLPWEYSRGWLEGGYFWNEQYLLQAFLAFNDHFEVVWSSCFTFGCNKEVVKAALRMHPGEPEGCGSFWMRKTR
jgi:hypothetical protein